MIRRHLRKLLLIVALIFLVNLSYAQVGAPPPDPGDPVPITGIEILIGLGALFGVKHLFVNRKNKH